MFDQSGRERALNQFHNQNTTIDKAVNLPLEDAQFHSFITARCPSCGITQNTFTYNIRTEMGGCFFCGFSGSGKEIKEYISFNGYSQAREFPRQLSLEENLGIRYSGPPTFYEEKLYGEREDEIENIVRENNRVILVSATGSGKTTVMVNVIKNMNIKTIFAVPYSIMAKLFTKRFKFDYINSERKDENEILDIVKNNLIVFSTYDGLQKLHRLAGYEEMIARESILVIDEIHNLVIQQDFRPGPLNFMESVRNSYWKNIGLTGTPEGTNFNYEGSFKIFGFQKSIPEKKSPIHFLPVKNENDLLIHAQTKAYENKIVIFIDDKTKLGKLDKLFKDNYCEPREVGLITADDKDSHIYRRIANRRTLGNIKVLLTTSVIAEGISIEDDDIDAFYAFDVWNLTKLRQFARRFRKGVGIIYDTITKENNSRDLFDFRYTYKLYNNWLQNTVRSFQLLNETGSDINANGMIASRFIDRTSNGYSVNSYGLTYELIRDIFQRLKEDHVKRAEFYLLFEKCKVYWENFEADENINEMLTRDRKQLAIDINSFIIDQLKNSAHYLLRKFELDISSNIEPIIQDFGKKTFRSRDVNKKSYLDQLERYLLIVNKFIPHTVAIKILYATNENRRTSLQNLIYKFDAVRMARSGITDGRRFSEPNLIDGWPVIYFIRQNLNQGKKFRSREYYNRFIANTGSSITENKFTVYLSNYFNAAPNTKGVRTFRGHHTYESAAATKEIELTEQEIQELENLETLWHDKFILPPEIPLAEENRNS